MLEVLVSARNFDAFNLQIVKCIPIFLLLLQQDCDLLKVLLATRAKEFDHLLV